MRQLILYIAASLDNFIAGEDGNVEWLQGEEYLLPDEDYGYGEFYGSVDTTLMGHNTYRVVDGFDMPFPYPDRNNYVFTRAWDQMDTSFVKFVHGDIVAFVRDLKAQEGKDIWLMGGGQINTLMLNNQLIDKIILTIMPVILGSGIPLFQGKPREVKFRQVSGRSYQNGVLQWTLYPDYA